MYVLISRSRDGELISQVIETLGYRTVRGSTSLTCSLGVAGCKVVVDHVGRPDVTLGLDDPGFRWLLRAADTGRVWVKLAAAYRSWPQQDAPGACAAAQALLRHFGAERLVWGSDWPNTQHREVADFGSTQHALAQWIPDAVARARILVDTSARLFRFL